MAQRGFQELSLLLSVDHYSLHHFRKQREKKDMFVSLYRGDMAALQRCTYVVGLLGSLRVRIAEQEEQEHTQHILVHSWTVLVDFLRLYERTLPLQEFLDFFSTSYSYGWNSYYTNNKMFRSIIRVGQAFGGVGRPAGLNTGHAAMRLFGKSSRSISYQR